MPLPKSEESMQTGIARALDETTESENRLVDAYATLRKAITPLGATLSAEQHARRDGEWQAYHAKHDLQNRAATTAWVIASIHDAFNAGWAARKQANYEMVFGLDKPKAE